MRVVQIADRWQRREPLPERGRIRRDRDRDPSRCDAPVVRGQRGYLAGGIELQRGRAQPPGGACAQRGRPPGRARRGGDGVFHGGAGRFPGSKHRRGVGHVRLGGMEEGARGVELSQRRLDRAERFIERDAAAPGLGGHGLGEIAQRRSRPGRRLARLRRERAVDRGRFLHRAREERVQRLAPSEQPGQLDVDTAGLAVAAGPSVPRMRGPREHDGDRALSRPGRYVEHLVELRLLIRRQLERRHESRTPHQDAQLAEHGRHVVDRHPHVAQLSLERDLHLLRDEDALAAQALRRAGRGRRAAQRLQRRRRASAEREEQEQEEGGDDGCERCPPA